MGYIEHGWTIEREPRRGDGESMGRAKERFQGVVSTMGRSTQKAVSVDNSFFEMWQGTF